MPRAPTDRALAWANWRRRLTGAHVPLNNDEPQCGLYKRKQFGRWVAVQIDLQQDTDPETGELIADERFAVFVNGEASKFDAGREWSFCADNPITEAEYERLIAAPVVRDLSKEVIV